MGWDKDEDSDRSSKKQAVQSEGVDRDGFDVLWWQQAAKKKKKLNSISFVSLHKSLSPSHPREMFCHNISLQ